MRRITNVLFCLAILLTSPMTIRHLLAQQQQVHGARSLGVNLSLSASTDGSGETDQTSAVLAMSATRFSASRAIEFGFDLTLLATSSGSGSNSVSSTTVNPNLVLRLNAKPKRFVPYFGLQAGMTTTLSDAGGTSTSSVGVSYGFQLGANIFMARNAAFNVQEDLNISSMESDLGSSGSTYSYTLSMGLRYFF